jgi:hypothetical protein
MQPFEEPLPFLNRNFKNLLLLSYDNARQTALAITAHISFQE